MIEIKTTCKNEIEAKLIASKLLENKMIACANYFNIKSMYSWEGNIETEEEVLLILKTNNKNQTEVMDEIIKLHSYELPVITIGSITLNTSAKDWINEVTK